MNDIKEKLFELSELFCLPGTIKDVKVISHGNINVSYDVTMEHEGEEQRYVFQKLNI